jgi:hypothetical protein
MIRPARQERLEDAGDGRLSDGHRSGDADDIRHPVRGLAEEGVGDAEELLGCSHVEVEQPGERQVDLLDLRHGELDVDAANPLDVLLRQRHRSRRAERRPLMAGELQKR